VGLKKSSKEILNILIETIFSDSLQNSFRVSNKDFTRKRKLTFSITLIFMMNLIKKTLVIEIDSFSNFLKYQKDNVISFDCFTSSAYVQSRDKIMLEVFLKLSSVLINEFYTDNDASIKLWKGLRLLAVDGSKVNLPSTKQTEQLIGYARNQS
jgi:hypothetical protein